MPTREAKIIPVAGAGEPGFGEGLAPFPRGGMPFSTSTRRELPGLCLATFRGGPSPRKPPFPGGPRGDELEVPLGDALGEVELRLCNSLERSLWTCSRKRSPLYSKSEPHVDHARPPRAALHQGARQHAFRTHRAARASSALATPSASRHSGTGDAALLLNARTKMEAYCWAGDCIPRSGV